MAKLSIDKAIKNLIAGRKDAGMIPADEYTQTIALAIEALQSQRERHPTNADIEQEVKKRTAKLAEPANNRERKRYKGKP